MAQLKTATAMTLVALPSLLAPNHSNAAQRTPNVIVIVVDDMGYGDWGCYGNTFHKTPNIDAMAAKGKLFTDFHSNGNVSSPTRAALMTGRYQQRAGIEGVVTAEHDRDKGIDPNSVTIAKLLRANNYETVIYGKWHLGYDPKFNPIHLGFDKFVGYVSGNVDYFSHIDMAGYRDWWHQDKLVEEEGYTTELITQYAQDYIAADHDKPYFLYLPYEACHTPLQGPEDGALRSLVNGRLVTKQQKRPGKVVYKEMVECLDECIGRLMTTLHESGEEENTFVMLFSDNGGTGAAYNDPWSGHKGTMYEGGHRVSTIAYWPTKIEAGSVCDQTLITMDLLPTICRLTSTPMGKNEFDGVDISSSILKDKKIKDRTLFWRMNKSIAARSQEWKMIINKDSRKGALYNLNDDVKEKNNLWEQHPDIVADLLQQIDDWEAQFTNL